MIKDKSLIDDFISKHTKSFLRSTTFVEYLYYLMKEHNFENASEIYAKANISRQLWSSIISEKSIPSLKTCLKIVFAMKLSNKECKYLLKKAGYTLASSSKYNLIIRYCLENEIYDVFKVNEILEEYGFEDSLIE